MVAYLGGHFYSRQWRHSEKLPVHSCPKNMEQNLIVFASNLQNTLNLKLQTSSIVEVLRSLCSHSLSLPFHVFLTRSHVAWCRDREPQSVSREEQ